MKKIISRLKYWGWMNTISKVYEKTIIDSKRFKGADEGIDSINLESYEVGKLPEEYDSQENMTVFYLLHQFYPEHQGGTERFVMNLATGMQQKGHKAIVFALGQDEWVAYPNRINNIGYRQMTIEGVKVIEFRYKKAPRGLFYKTVDCKEHVLYQLAEYFLDQYKPHMVHCAYPQPMAAFLQCCIDRGQPYILTLTDFNTVCHYATMIRKDGALCMDSDKGQMCSKQCNTIVIQDFQERYRNMEHLLEHAKYIICPSKFAGNMIHREFNKLAPLVIAHGIGEQFKPKGNKVIDKNNIRYAYIGKLAPLKGAHLLIEAFKKSEVKGKLDIYGTGNPFYLKELKKIIGDHPSITLRGSVAYHQVFQVYDTHEVVVVPSMCYETYNFVAREAMACGCFVIGADIGAIPEVIEKGKNGTLFKAGNVPSLVQAIRTAENATITEKGKSMTIDEEIDTYIMLYTKCLGR